LIYITAKETLMIIYLLEFIVEVLKYSLGYFIGFSQTVIRRWVYLVGGVIYFILILILEINHNTAIILMVFLVVVLTLFCMEGKGHNKLMQVLILCFIIVCLDEFILALVKHIHIIVMKTDFVSVTSYLINSSLSCIIILVIALIKKRYINYTINNILWVKNGMNFLVIIMGISMLFTIAGLVYAGTKIDNDEFALLATNISMIAYFSTGMLGIISIIINNLNEQLKRQAEIEHNLITMQKRYYEALLEKEADTKGYRHDLNGHLTYLYDNASEGNLEEVKKYIVSMQGEYEIINSKAYYTGNKILDTFINYYVPMLDNDTSFIFNVRCKCDLEISDIDMCIIFSNLMQNALENISKNNMHEKYLKINIQQGNSYIKIQIVNTTLRTTIVKRKGYTSKIDKKNHGLGLENVKKAIKRNNGKFMTECNTGEFIATVILKCQS